MKLTKKQILDNLFLIEILLDKATIEIYNSETDAKGMVKTAYNGKYSLNKVKRNCTTIRDLLLEIRKSCEF